MQLTPSGELIVLHRDCQVTGGYPRVLLTDEKGLNQIAQIRQGATIQLELDDLSNYLGEYRRTASLITLGLSKCMGFV